MTEKPGDEEVATIQLTPSLQVGESAPNFTLPAVNREGTVSLADYRGKSPLLVGLFRGLYCPLCRRKIAEMGLEREKLLAAGVETLGVVASKLEHARLYFRYHPTRLLLAADPAMNTLRDFRVPKPQVTPQLLQGYQSVRVDPYSELSEPVPITELATTLNHLDGYEYNETDLSEIQQQWGFDTATQLMGRFLIDRYGIVQWVDIECAKDGLAGFGKLSSEAALLAAVRAL
jgi:peroxiredoxin